MATHTIPSPTATTTAERKTATAPSWTTFRRLLLPVASLKLTVVLFVMAIFIVLAGTLAQVEQDIWAVVHGYFRTAFAWIPVHIFFPKSFFPGMNVPDAIALPGGWTVPFGFYFPGGWLIGGLMAVNLLAAHGLRFTLQARGNRLYTGLGVLGVGILMTVLVVLSGDNKDGLQGRPWLEWSSLWNIFVLGLVALWLLTVYGLIKLDSSRRMERWGLSIFGLILGGVLCWLFYQGPAARLNDSAMRILWQLMKGGFAAVVLLAACLMLFKKRAGIVLLHAGIGVMMLGEVMVGLSAVEGQMHIKEGQSVNFVRDTRTLELAVVDPSDPKTDTVVVVPESILLSGKTIHHDDLPFDVRVDRFMKNSTIRKAKPGDDNPATAGAGLQWVAEELRPSSGTDSAVDVASAYVTLLSKDGSQPLGTYLLSQHLADQSALYMANTDVPERVAVDGKTYDVALRFKRDYKPYWVYLKDIRKKDYIGTATPQDYSSFITLNDKNRGVDFEKRIWMNNPLRYAGETFYQSNYHKHPTTGQEATTLQVVSNTGWMIPYVGCMIVAVGLLFQFGNGLVRFLNRQNTAAARDGSAGIEIVEEEAPSQNGTGDKTRKGKPKRAETPTTAQAIHAASWSPARLIVPGVVVLLFGGWLAGKAMPPKQPDDGFNLSEFGKIPVAYEGRVKPIDTMARTTLRMLSGRETFIPHDAKTKRMFGIGPEKPIPEPPIRWLLDAITESKDSYKHRVFRIENLEVLDMLGLQPRPGFRYALEEIGAHLDEIQDQAERAKAAAAKSGPENLTVYQRKVIALADKLQKYFNVVLAFRQPALPSLPDPKLITKDPEKAREGLSRFQAALSAARQSQQKLAESGPPLAVPVQVKDDEPRDQLPPILQQWLPERPDWETYATAWTNAYIRQQVFRKEINDPTLSLQNILHAYSQGDVKAFNSEVAKYQAALQAEPPAQFHAGKVGFEAYFNHFAPFYHCVVLYLVAFVLTGLSWMFTTTKAGRPLRWSAFALIAFTFLVHTSALIGRIYISGRPPVTNLYSSAVFIGWGAVLLGIVFELVFRIGIGNAIAAMAGFATLLIAHFLAADGDTFTVMQAVLDTQFWLATHVVCVTLGYATTFVAGLLGVIYILAGVTTPTLTSKVGSELFSRTLTRMIYGTLCFALFFSFVGTVLGGLWADDSWGRFWGWDPKENGALIIVLWNALVLHARWDGMVKERGLAVLAVAGNVTTSWSWFGVNELGIGLHSYGFTEGVLLALGLFVLSQLVIVGLGVTPKSWWWSFRRQRHPSTAGA